jgi:hypothetical protein
MEEAVEMSVSPIDTSRDTIVDSLEKAMATGEMLLEAKALVPPGGWRDFLTTQAKLEREFRGTRDDAYMCMRLATEYRRANDLTMRRLAEILFEEWAAGDRPMDALAARRKRLPEEPSHLSAVHLVAQLTPVDGLDDDGDEWWKEAACPSE